MNISSVGKLTLIASGLAGVLGFASGCSSDETPAPPTTQPDAATGSDAKQDQSNGDSSAPLKCGTEVCASLADGAATTLSFCCATPTTCGYDISAVTDGGGCLDPRTVDASSFLADAAPPVPDPSCGTVTLVGVPLAGCCLPDGTCGHYNTALPVCLSNAQLNMVVTSAGLPADAGTCGDGGTPDTGTTADTGTEAGDDAQADGATE